MSLFRWLFGSPKREPYPRVNGVYASKAQLRLAKSLGAKYVNYKACGYYIDIAFPRKRIAIEYDGAYWHQNKKKEKIRDAALVRCGWRVLHIRSNGHIPSPDVVKKELKRLSWRNPVVTYNCEKLSSN